MTDEPLDAWDEPEGLAARGTLIVAAGRGERPRVYERFGRRLSFDAYKVRVLSDVTADLDAAFARAEKLLVDSDLPAPRVLVGSDTGALFALALAARRAPGVDALVLAGLPTTGLPTAGLATNKPETSTTVSVITPTWDEELAARTACPTHQRVISEVHPIERGALFSARIPTELIEHIGFAGILDLAGIDVPVLGLHGTDDPISPLAAAHAAYATAPAAQVVSLNGGMHDALNDAIHRTVAATIVLFLERLRLGPALPEIAHIEPAGS
jgi:pimeloyl-ACP methyl ester carboxylesterase